MSASVATAGFGTLFKFTISASLTTIAEVTDISGPELSAGTIEVTHMESPGGSSTMMAAREYIGGLVDNGTVTLTLNFLPANTGHAALMSAVGLKAATAASIVFPDSGAGTFTFSCFVTKFTPKAPVDSQLSADVEFKIAGVVTYAA